MERITELIPPAWQFPEVTATRITLGKDIFQTNNFRVTPWIQTREIVVNSHLAGQLEVCYLEERPASDEGPFLFQERNLLNTIAQRIGSICASQQASAVLSESERCYAQLAEQSGTVVWAVDAQGLYSRVNQVAQTVWGYGPDEIVGRLHFYDLHPESGREAFKQAAFAVFAQKKPFKDLINPVLAKDGRVRWFSTNGLPQLDVDGTLLGYSGSDTDITERKQTDEALLRRTTELLAINTELNRFNRVAVGREVRIIDLKEEINELCRAAGQPKRYGTQAIEALAQVRDGQGEKELRQGNTEGPLP
jgi:PAS domain S-box-containing protein